MIFSKKAKKKKLVCCRHGSHLYGGSVKPCILYNLEHQCERQYEGSKDGKRENLVCLQCQSQLPPGNVFFILVLFFWQFWCPLIILWHFSFEEILFFYCLECCKRLNNCSYVQMHLPVTFKRGNIKCRFLWGLIMP